MEKLKRRIVDPEKLANPDWVLCPYCGRYGPQPSFPNLCEIDCARCGYFKPSLKVRCASLKSRALLKKSFNDTIDRKVKELYNQQQSKEVTP